MRRWLSVVALGVLLGVATAWSDEMAGGLQQDGLNRALSMVLNAGSAWAGLAVLSGWIVGRPRAAAAAGVVGLLCAVGGYYAYGVVLGDRTQVGLAGLTGVIRLWAVLAIVAGPALGVAGALIRRSGMLGLLAALVVPVGVIVEMVGLRRLGPGTFAVDPALAWAQALLVVVATLGAVAALLVRLRPSLDRHAGVTSG